MRKIALFVLVFLLINLPLMVVEGAPNSALHRYPNQFLEKWVQLSEIDLYVRICRDAQVSTIME